MASGDVAILTGITYYPGLWPDCLQGPRNDLDLVEDWLRNVAGVDRIIRVESPPAAPVVASSAQPLLRDFQLQFEALASERLALNEARLANRLYLYFAGHGFSGRSDQAGEEAAILAANAVKPFLHHINGTVFAQVACNWALFAEVVLIMDCCRGASDGKLVPLPYSDLDCADLASKVRSVAIYAVPRGADAPEAAIPERGGKVHGLLTHVLMKLLDEVRPASTKGLSASELRDQLTGSWPVIVGNGFAVPRVLVGGAGDVYFPTSERGNVITFAWTPQQAGTELLLCDGALRQVARFDLHRDQRLDIPPPGQNLEQRLTPGALRLTLPDGIYEYRVTGTVQRESRMLKVIGGSQHVEL